VRSILSSGEHIAVSAI